ncbi:hypothetical protein Moror_5604 [Moniliophthora roreri MCA 2997]|uniref:Uncharacterized protein n=1 Tax=Moniliophthora roreri (strain MCA 2997) TaxID=1381753 RepID=V2Y8Y7_MONRO|nr:hypothetical protein Moror_5604 [Moniliophthora roreri MCA 2997]
MEYSNNSFDAGAVRVTTSFSLAHYLTFSSVVIGPVIVTGIQFLLYGLYIPLFYGALYVLKHRRPGPTRETQLHRISMIILFVLATMGLFINTSRIIWNCSMKFEFVRVNAQDGDFNSKTTRTMDGLMMAVLSLSNIAADTVLIFRCYSIWGFRRRIIVAPAIGCTISNLLGVASMALYLRVGGISDEWFARSRLIIGMFLIVNAAMNVFLTLMVAGRIWFITRISVDKQAATRYNLIAALVLESGMLYPFALILDCIVNTNKSMVGWDLHPLLVHVAGIAPTLIIVRAGLGITVEVNHGGFHASDLQAGQTVSGLVVAVNVASVQDV